MNPRPARILTCPYCYREMQVLSLNSGNNIGMDEWSDAFSIAPMLPFPYPVQKCPHCGKYFLISRQSQEKKYGAEISFDKGELIYPELKEAFEQSNSSLTESERISMSFMLIHSFNNIFQRTEGKLDFEIHKHRIRLCRPNWEMNPIFYLL